MLATLKSILRFGWVALLSIAFIPLFLLRNWLGPGAGPRLARWYFQCSGGAFLKCGQILATRYDLMPHRYCEELGKLLDRLPPVPTRRILRVIEREFGLPSEELFSAFEPVPLASASIAQVHAAALWSGERVVLKIKKPHIDHHFRADFLLIKGLARLLDSLLVFNQIDLGAVARELVDLASEELDFRREAQNADRLHQLLLSDDIDHYSPKVHFSFSGDSIIALERIEGITLQQLFDRSGDVNRNAPAQGAETNINLRRLAKLLLRSVMEQTMRHRFFQADPHPANLLVTNTGTLVWLDFGMTGWLDERSWRLQFNIRKHVAEGRIHGAYQSLLKTLEPLPPGRDLTRFESEVKGYLQDWIWASRSATASLVNKSSGSFLLRTFDAIRRAGLRMPMNVMRLYRCIIISDMVVLRLDPSMDWVPVLQEFIEEETSRERTRIISELFSPAAWGSPLRAWAKGTQALAELANWVLDRLPETGQTHTAEPSRSERALLVSLEYGRMALFVMIVVLLGSHFVAGAMFPHSGWRKVESALGDFYWPAILLGGLGMVYVTRLIARFRSP